MSWWPSGRTLERGRLGSKGKEGVVGSVGVLGSVSYVSGVGSVGSVSASGGWGWSRQWDRRSLGVGGLVRVDQCVGRQRVRVSQWDRGIVSSGG